MPAPLPGVQARQRLIEPTPHHAPVQGIFGLLGHALDQAFVTTATFCGAARMAGHVQSNSVKPPGNAGIGRDMVASAGEHQEGGLGRIVCRRGIAQDAAADREHHRRMAFHQDGECGLIVVMVPGIEQFTIGWR